MESDRKKISAYSPAIILFLLNIATAMCQDIVIENTGGTTQYLKPVISLYEADNLNDVKTLLRTPKEETAPKEVILYRYSVEMLRPQSNIRPEKPLDVVGSFRSNIRFGGFWEQYAILNFTPQIYFKPLDFIGIFASHNISYFIPMEKIRENIKGFAIEGAAIMAVETTFRFLNPRQSFIGKALNFLAKNLIISYMTGLVRGDKDNGVVDFGNYYYSISIRF